jgi:Flp pilus assembly protein TadB
MASVVDTPEERTRYLRAVLKLNPKNKTAKKHLARLEDASSARDRKLVRYGLIAAVAAVLILVVVVVAAIVLTSIL